MTRGITAILIIIGFGLMAEDLTTLSGKTYKNIKVRSIYTNGLQIMHDGGISVNPSFDLPPELREKYKPQKKTVSESTPKGNGESPEVERAREYIETIEKVALRAEPVPKWKWDLPSDIALREYVRGLRMDFIQNVNMNNFVECRNNLSGALVTAFENHTLTGYCYNRKLNVILPVIMSLGVYEGTYDVYLQLGGGEDCLLVDLIKDGKGTNFGKLVEALKMVMEWNDQTVKEGTVAELTKEVPNMPEDISFIFCRDKGSLGRISVMAGFRGRTAQSGLPKEMFVILTDIGYNTLYFQMVELLKILEKRIIADKNMRR